VEGSAIVVNTVGIFFVNGVFKAEKTFDVYTIDGIRVATNVSNFSTMKKGVYIVNGKKVIVK
jgi:sRNA-binding regulator protein Hfq